MFNGFPVTNTPAVQVWDFVRGASTSALRSVILTDDCAPIQFFKTGVPSEINLYLPPSYPEGKVLTIINSPYLTTAVSIVIYASDARNTSTGVSGTGDNIYRTRPGHTLQFFYTKATLDQATGATFVTGWNCISQGSANSSAPNSFATAGGTTLATNAFAAGGSAVASALQSAVVGGQLNTASGTGAAVIGGSSNTASQTNAIVIGGSGNTASGSNSALVGGSSNSASSSSCGIFAGSNNSNSSTYGGVLAGYGHQANGSYNAIVGGASGSNRSLVGYTVFPASSTPVGVNTGGSQVALLVIGTQTTDATVTTLRSDTSAASTTNQLVLASNSAYYVRGSCIANVTGGGNTKAWSFEAVIKRSVIASSTSIVGAVIKNIVAADAGAATWDITLSADTTNGAFRVQVTGQAATTIRWTCRLDSTEVAF
jgi:hypothetical protein